MVSLVARCPQAVYSEQNDEGAEVLYYAFPMTKYMVDDGWGGTTPFLKLDTLADGKTVKDVFDQATLYASIQE